MESISKKDLGILRELAKKQYEYSQSDEMKALKAQWLLHNTFKGSRPMVHIEMGTFEHEIIPTLLKCSGKTARELETGFYRNFLNHELFADDYVVKDYYPVGYSPGIKLFGLDIEIIQTGGLGHKFAPLIHDLKEDFPKFKKSSYIADKNKTHEKVDYINTLFGDILPAKLEGTGLYAVPTQQVVHFMGMEYMMISMYDYPDEFKKMMDMIADEYIDFFKYLEQNRLLLPTTGGELLGQGTWCYTDELPGREEYEKRALTPGDVWGFMDSQETVGISVAMFKEFILPCYERIARGFGLLSYGCCEPVDSIFDDFLSKLSNLRKVSVSPWCNEEFMGERLRGGNIIYHRKPSPNFLGVGAELDEEAFAAHIDKTIAAAKGCSLEITQRDVYSISHNPDKVRRYVEIIRHRCE